MPCILRQPQANFATAKFGFNLDNENHQIGLLKINAKLLIFIHQIMQ